MVPQQEMMKHTKTILRIFGILLLELIVSHAQAVTLTALVSFAGTNGAFPSAGLIQAKDGNFYGTTASGGPGGYGTVFRMTPSGTFTNLIAFNSTNGAGPRAGLVQGTDGSFYGTTYNGGSNNAGTVFQLTTNRALTTLVTLTFANTGAYPIAGLIQGQDGNFYGTTAIGGTNSGGTAFQVMTNRTLTPLVSFNITGNVGNSPYAGLVQVSDGTLYGTTYQGGTNGFGTIFKVTTNGTFLPLHSFNGTNDGANPSAGLVQGQDGSFYGTTFNGGTNGYGTVFRFATNGALATLVSFGNTNGAYPQAAVLQGSDGSLYGTTYAGGAYTNLSGLGYGTVFKLGTNGGLTTLISFDGTNGSSPEAGLIQGADGNLYGTTAMGGTNGHGTVFRLTITAPPPPEFQAVRKIGATLTMTWSATVGQTYQMLFKTNLNQITWNNFGPTVLGTNAVMTTLDTIGPDPRRFYRVLLLQ
jgi:uncharacterized repeat protein (TIGR03803 family)